MKINKLVWWNIGAILLTIVALVLAQIIADIVTPGSRMEIFSIIFIFLVVIAFLSIPMFSISSLMSIKKNGGAGKIFSYIILGSWVWTVLYLTFSWT